MHEMNTLEIYLKTHNIPYERVDKAPDSFGFDFHKITVNTADGQYLWDAICHRGSFGYEQGLLEIYGIIVDEEQDGDSVVGWLTASDVIKRIEKAGVQE